MADYVSAYTGEEIDQGVGRGMIAARQYLAMPTPSAAYADVIAQYIGLTGDYVNGYWYKCELADDDYIWSEISAPGVPAGGTAGQVLQKVDGTDYNTWWKSLGAADVGAVPTTRKVNNKALSTNITLSAADVGAPPATHAHGNVTSDGKIGTTADLPLFTGAGGAIGTKSAADALAALGIPYGTGTWTPTLGYGSNSSTPPTYTASISGTYTRIGRIVIATARVSGAMTITDIGSGSTPVIRGLPFAAAAGNAIAMGWYNRGGLEVFLTLGNGTLDYGYAVLDGIQLCNFSSNNKWKAATYNYGWAVSVIYTTGG